MKTIGIIGGMSWESTSEYYRLLNEGVKERLGGLHSTKCIVYSVDFEEIEKYQSSGNWEQAGKVLADAAKSLEEAGADLIILATNTMHKVMHQIEQAVAIPTLHIADATAEVIKSRNLKKIGLLGTKYTMEQDFYKERVASHGIEIVVPEERDRNVVNDIIFQELVMGEIKESSRIEYLEIVSRLVDQGVEGVILGCTEIGLLIKQKDVSLPLFDTSHVHVGKALDQALAEN
ncbi:aspartate racemase [Halalkalibacillus sediminis]|uniref:Aspartate racemase n=1 Tax=Halalkalibacillus sediminis TaxID=2018042 RepID=A0A2I0QS20_9BACI|nr:aspartate/glutamate racemase family protein [Halalkalibacillus sediminis]PKR77118.1 aspartate racemase [Halalkalibacillus sediminis]